MVETGTVDRLGLLAAFVAAEKEVRDLDARLKAAKGRRSELEQTIFTEVFEAGFAFQNITLDGMTVYLHRQLWARAKSGQSEALVEALKAAGMGDMVKESFNTNTLSAWVREHQKEGEYDTIEALVASLPEPIQQSISVAEKFSLRATQA